MARLKADTAHLHARIEQVVPLLRDELDLSAFRRHVEQVHGFVGPLESRLQRFEEGFAAWGVELGARRRAALLADDLVELGASPESLAALPACAALPAVRSLEEAWGCLYVLEGSTLGGQVLLRTLAPRLGLTAARGLRYFAGHGEHTGSRWKELCASIERFAEAGCDRGRGGPGRVRDLRHADRLAGRGPPAAGVERGHG